MGVEYRKIYINVHEDGEGGISISECEVELDESWFPRHQEIREALLDRPQTVRTPVRLLLKFLLCGNVEGQRHERNR